MSPGSPTPTASSPPSARSKREATDSAGITGSAQVPLPSQRERLGEAPLTWTSAMLETRRRGPHIASPTAVGEELDRSQSPPANTESHESYTWHRHRHHPHHSRRIHLHAEREAVASDELPV